MKVPKVFIPFTVLCVAALALLAVAAFAYRLDQTSMSHRRPVSPSKREAKVDMDRMPKPEPVADGPYHIRMYNGGQLVGEWMSVATELCDYKDGIIYFTDALTNRKTAVKGEGVVVDYTGRPAEALALLDEIRSRSDIPR